MGPLVYASGNRNTNSIKIAIENGTVHAGKTSDTRTLQKCAKKCGNKRNMRQSHILVARYSRVVSVPESGAEGPGFKSQPRRCRVTALGKLFTPIMPLFTKQRNWQQPLTGREGNCRPGGK